MPWKKMDRMWVSRSVRLDAAEIADAADEYESSRRGGRGFFRRLQMCISRVRSNFVALRW